MITREATKTGTIIRFTESWKEAKEKSEEESEGRVHTGSSPRKERTTLRFSTDNPLFRREPAVTAMFLVKEGDASHSQNSVSFVDGKRFPGIPPTTPYIEDDED